MLILAFEAPHWAQYMDQTHAGRSLDAYVASFSRHLSSLLGGVAFTKHILPRRFGYILFCGVDLEWMGGRAG
ncbi:hypothetical protein N7509_000640 [Penicillium cosmopolitanum]|uniref:Uncharacterized protein n=1 Tax=Penicillium cosmopolitanum TaxID=1131564 RepID=A0A9W9WB03_9EURO|nr:uncharacterized protein N7509_000640 [Penicillium cosmopolitanum]KAJ5414013.1 hypothetical protein N7509_000640 [Penicillium cosmopolitanum]